MTPAFIFRTYFCIDMELYSTFLEFLDLSLLKVLTAFNILEEHSKATFLLVCNNAAQGIPSSFFFNSYHRLQKSKMSRATKWGCRETACSMYTIIIECYEICVLIILCLQNN